MIKRESVEIGLSREIGIMRKPIADSYLRYLLEEVAELENAVFDILDKLDISKAEGTLLDYIGALVGAYREGKSDFDFRSAIRFQITLNTADGLSENVLEVIRSITNDSSPVLTNYFPAEFNILVSSDTLPTLDLLNKVSGAGILPTLSYVAEDRLLWVMPEVDEVGLGTNNLLPEISQVDSVLSMSSMLLSSTYTGEVLSGLWTDGNTIWDNNRLWYNYEVWGTGEVIIPVIRYFLTLTAGSRITIPRTTLSGAFSIKMSFIWTGNNQLLGSALHSSRGLRINNFGTVSITNDQGNPARSMGTANNLVTDQVYSLEVTRDAANTLSFILDGVTLVDNLVDIGDFTFDYIGNDGFDGFEGTIFDVEIKSEDVVETVLPINDSGSHVLVNSASTLGSELFVGDEAGFINEGSTALALSGDASTTNTRTTLWMDVSGESQVIVNRNSNRMIVQFSTDSLATAEPAVQLVNLDERHIVDIPAGTTHMRMYYILDVTAINFPSISVKACEGYADVTGIFPDSYVEMRQMTDGSWVAI